MNCITLFRTLMAVHRMLAGRCPVVVFLLVSATALADQGPEQHFDRGGFGRSELPLWSELTPFEQRILASWDRARSGDADTLLALYLMASGDVRTEAVYQQYRQRIQAYPLPAEELNARQRGRQLLDGLFADFYRWDGNGEGTLSGYLAEQSQLSELLDSGVYNCISSSLLYVVLARRAGLQASGVILPSHAFVELTLPDGQTLSVETTSPDGFDVTHDRAWFRASDESWFDERGLEVPRYEDYQQRRRVTAAGLGLENMWNQHAARLPYRDRLRLAEIHAHLQPDNLQAQRNRMIYYTRELVWLREEEDHATLRRLLRQIRPWRDRLADRAETMRDDPEWSGLWYGLEVQRAAAEVASGAVHAGGRRALTVLESLPARVHDRHGIRHNAQVVLDDYARRVVADGELEEAGPLMSRLAGALCEAGALCQQALARYHSGLAAQDWEAGEWSAAIAHFRDYLQLPGDERFRASIEQNMEGAWLNWAEKNWYDEYREQAMERLRRCVRELEQAPRCRQRLDEYQAAW